MPAANDTRTDAHAHLPQANGSPRPSARLSIPATALGLVLTAALVVSCGDGGKRGKSGEAERRDSAKGSATAAQEPVSAKELAGNYAKLRKAAEASKAADDWFALAAWCDESGYQAEQNRARKLYRYIVFKVDADHAGARKKLGYVFYDGPIEKYARLKWLKAEDLRKVRALEAKEQKHRAALESDPWYQASEKIIRHLSGDKELAGFEFEFKRYPPFLIAKQKKNPETDAYKIRMLGEMLQAAAGDFVTTFKSLGLKSLSEVEFKGRLSVLPIIYFESKISFERYHLAKGQEVPKGMAAYFMPSTNRIVYYEGTGKGAEKFNIDKLVHEEVHQLVWFYTPSRSHCQLHLFQEGIAEFFAGTSRKSYTNDQGGRSYHYTFQGKLKQRMKHLKQARQTHWFSYEDLLQIRTKADLDRVCRKKAGEDEGARASCGALFYAEAWSLIYYLWHHKDGVYRNKLIEYAGLEFEGKTGIRYFRKVFGDDELRKIGVEWRKFVNSSGPFLKDV